MRLNINSDALVKYTNKLEKLHRSGLPITVRNTLSQAALNLKQETMPKSSNKAFKVKSKNFFKANSKVNFAKGFDIKTMQSEVGFFSNKLSLGGKNYAVKNLEQQESGGVIKSKSLIASKEARRGGLTRHEYRISNFDKSSYIDANEIKTRKSKRGKVVKVSSKKERYILAAYGATMKGKKFIRGNIYGGGKSTISKINSISSNIKSKKLSINRTPIYSVKKGRSVSVRSTDFMKRASHESSLNMNKYYIKEAEKQFKRLALK